MGRAEISVDKITTHPDWDSKTESYDADIAILQLLHEVEYSSSIQPICLMKPFTFLSTINRGTAVGFGQSEDETKDYENIARHLITPIVNNEICFLQNNFLSDLSSNRTFCGGFANGSGVCNGDSGGGLVVFYNDTFYLRGIVSASLRGTKYSCNVKTYSIFTDAVKFYTWIRTGNFDIYGTIEDKIQDYISSLMETVRGNETISKKYKRLKETVFMLLFNEKFEDSP